MSRGIFFCFVAIGILVNSGLKVVENGVIDFKIEQGLFMRSIFEVWNGMR
jgi:hypothetical protein